MIIHEGMNVRLGLPEADCVYVVDFLGSGGYADVWKVQETTTGKFYALKHVRIKAKDPDQVAKLAIRLSSEAHIKLDSPYIVKSYGLSNLGGGHFAILLEYVEGEDLDEWIARNKSAPWHVRKSLFLKILEGVETAHKNGIIHKDLKPENIRITRDQTPKISDFGLASIKDQNITETGDPSGTLPYMAPEIFGGAKKVDARYDIYALGCILYTLVKGKNYCDACGFDVPPFTKMMDKDSSTTSSILDFDHSFSCDDRAITTAIREASRFDLLKRLKSVAQLRLILEGKRTWHFEWPDQKAVEIGASVLGLLLGLIANIQNELPIFLFSLSLFLSPVIGFIFSKLYRPRGVYLLFYFLIFQGGTLLAYKADMRGFANILLYTNFWVGLLLALTNTFYFFKGQLQK